MRKREKQVKSGARACALTAGKGVGVGERREERTTASFLPQLPRHTDNEITATSCKGSLFSPILSNPGFFLQSGGSGGLRGVGGSGRRRGASPRFNYPIPRAPSPHLASPVAPDNEKKKKKKTPPAPPRLNAANPTHPLRPQLCPGN